jgi:hypothetical protein
MASRSSRRFRVDLNGLGEIGDGAVEIKRPEMRGPPTEVRGGIISIALM